MNLGTLLLRNGTIGLTDLETALRQQSLFGGKLGTNLVELGLLEIDVLSHYLAELLGVPAASDAMLANLSHEVLSTLDVAIATQCQAIPLGTVDGEFAVALVEPTNASTLHDLSTALGYKFVPYVIPQMRAAHFLELHYGVVRPARFVRSAGDAYSDHDARRRVRAPEGRVMPSAATIYPRRHQPTVPPPLSVPPDRSYDETRAALEQASTRDQLADALLGYCRGRTAGAAMLTVRDGYALGWRAWSGAPANARMIEEVAIPLGVASALQHAHDRRMAYWGPPVGLGRQEEPVRRALGGHAAEAIAVVPLLVGQQVVALVYAHECQENTCAGLAELAVLASAVFGRMATRNWR